MKRSGPRPPPMNGDARCLGTPNSPSTVTSDVRASGEHDRNSRRISVRTFLFGKRRLHGPRGRRGRRRAAPLSSLTSMTTLFAPPPSSFRFACLKLARADAKSGRSRTASSYAFIAAW